ncbi:hypothetical protein IE81DRAFT_364508 [Ceraceosorus guamensis]|uniref:Uncharacterized protein n=1 Tax=Ceraceosorus guamensis TaxID=1522189 RepID=A0A316W5K6_9BASI|nr:hypothetical protein IE81DRAFT_364508 [Ceraceosorus guamensis]PWN45147.1 hypothetical protein IE81DRAFT_364508 [Ceraceosorus guamensis]
MSIPSSASSSRRQMANQSTRRRRTLFSPSLAASLAILLVASCSRSLVAARKQSTSSDSSGPSDSDPGIYPGGKDGFTDGWSVLPNVTGARLDMAGLRVGDDAAAQSADSSDGAITTTTTPMLPYYITDKYDSNTIKRAVIQIHGDNRDAWNQWLYADLALDRAVQGGTVKREEVAIMAPQFLTTIDYLAYGAISEAVAPASSLMVWNATADDWGDGFPPIFPARSTVGAFDALDSALDFFLDRQTFPNLVTVVLAGFSMGGQLVQRYAMFRNEADQEDEERIHYWIGAPASFVYLNDSRPETVRRCKDFNEYKYGLEGTLPPYLDGRPKAEDLGPRYVSRRTNYLVGTRDKIDGDPRCEADAQGRTHLNKTRFWVEDVVPYLPGAPGNGQLPVNSTIDYVSKVSHQDWRVIASDAGVQRLFLDDYSAIAPAAGDQSTSARAPPSNGDGNVSPTDIDNGKADDDGDGKKNNGAGRSARNSSLRLMLSIASTSALLCVATQMVL